MVKAKRFVRAATVALIVACGTVVINGNATAGGAM